ncbi:MAG: hypothetical protein WC843_00380 [Candidatus Gracilibacteria bacterium]|jgi:hypothetical protein
MPFIQEFQNLLLTKPRFNLKSVMAENCDYADTAVKSKNCYYSFGTFYCEDVYFARYSRKCSNSSGLTFCMNCEWCSECIDCVNCYMADYCQDCSNCAEVQFCQDCFGCKNCFGCVGLYQKQYCFFNKQLSKEEYERNVKAYQIQNTTYHPTIRAKMREIKKTIPQIGIHQVKTEDCVGDHITESKNCYQCYDIFASEDCFYNIEANGNKDSCDITVCFETEACYSCVQSPLNYNCNFLFQVDNSSDSEFCAYSRKLKDCFGCVYLENKEYHILNKPYSPEEYKKEVQRIKAELQKSGQYNMNLFLVSDYEKKRIATETDSVISP